MAVIDPRYVNEDLLAMAEDGRRHELLEGDLLVSPSPKPQHQRIVKNIVAVLAGLEAAGFGRVYPAPLDVAYRHTRDWWLG